jgi:hypothetical protein
VVAQVVHDYVAKAIRGGFPRNAGLVSNRVLGKYEIVYSSKTAIAPCPLKLECPWEYL